MQYYFILPGSHRERNWHELEPKLFRNLSGLQSQQDQLVLRKSSNNSTKTNVKKLNLNNIAVQALKIFYNSWFSSARSSRHVRMGGCSTASSTTPTPPFASLRTWRAGNTNGFNTRTELFLEARPDNARKVLFIGRMFQLHLFYWIPEICSVSSFNDLQKLF